MSSGWIYDGVVDVSWCLDVIEARKEKLGVSECSRKVNTLEGGLKTIKGGLE